VVAGERFDADGVEVLEVSASDGAEAENGDLHQSPAVLACKRFHSRSYWSMRRTSRSTISSRSPYSSTALNFLLITAVTLVASPRWSRNSSRLPSYCSRIDALQVWYHSVPGYGVAKNGFTCNPRRFHAAMWSRRMAKSSSGNPIIWFGIGRMPASIVQRSDRSLVAGVAPLPIVFITRAENVS